MVSFPASSTGWVRSESDQTEGKYFEACLSQIEYSIVDDWRHPGRQTFMPVLYRASVVCLQEFPKREWSNFFRKKKILFYISAFTIEYCDGPINPSKALMRAADKDGIEINSYVLYRVTREAAEKLREMCAEKSQYNRSNYMLA